jgi:thioredoxin 2
MQSTQEAPNTAAQSSQHVVCPHCSAINRIPGSRPAAQAKCGTCHQPLFSGASLAADTKLFDRHITRDEIPVVAEFWAPWCGPCRQMGPAVERAAAELEPGYRVLKVNIDEEQALASRYGISSIPTLMLFANGKPVGQLAGARDTRSIVAWIRSQTQPTRENAHAPLATPDDPRATDGAAA